MDGHLGCFSPVATVNLAAKNTGVPYLVEYLLSDLWDIYLGVEFLGHVVTLCLTF